MRDQLLLERARSMRREMTGPEQRLWLELRARRLAGAKFRRQQVIGHYIADFACRTPRKLVIEVDGETHSRTKDYDQARTRHLQECGYRVIRFSNSDVMSNLDGVLLTIQSALEQPPLPDPLP